MLKMFFPLFLSWHTQFLYPTNIVMTLSVSYCIQYSSVSVCNAPCPGLQPHCHTSQCRGGQYSQRRPGDHATDPDSRWPPHTGHQPAGGSRLAAVSRTGRDGWMFCVHTNLYLFCTLIHIHIHTRHTVYP